MTKILSRVLAVVCLALAVLGGLCFSTSNAWGQQAITAAAFGMQCGQATGVVNCAATNGVITLPSEPGTLRLWDSEVQWNSLNYEAGSVCGTPPCMQWGIFDEYLNAIASASNISAVIYTFGDVPCWDITGCGNTVNNTAEANPPSDLGVNGSATFNAFVQALVTHCASSTHGLNCVGKCPQGQTCNRVNLIQYYELWNEANSTNYWNPPALGNNSAQQLLYELVAPAVPIIKANVNGAQFLTPSTNYGVGNQESWMNSWVAQEESSGLISTYYNFHLYLETYSSEQQYYCLILPQPPSNCGTGNGVLYPNYYPPTGTHAWKALPWINSETNFTDNTYTCTFSSTDCAGQVVRWQALQAANLPTVPTGDSSNGAANVSWYRWKATIGDYSGSGTSTLQSDYYYGEQFMELGYFNGACTASVIGSTTDIYCPFLESKVQPNVQAYWVWTNNESGSNCPVPTFAYKDYRSVSDGTTTPLSGSSISSIACTVQPILLEQ